MQTLVFVDDEVRQCRSMKKIIERLFPQLTVETFTNPIKAVEYIQAEAVRLIITDICMPDMDGLTLVKKLMESDQRRKVILLTGYAEFEYARKAVSAGAYDFLLKPMNPVKLKEVLEKCMEEIRRESQSDQDYKQVYHKLDEAWPAYMENLMNQWLVGSLTEEEQKKVSQIFPQEKGGNLLLTRFFGLERWREGCGSQEYLEMKKKLGMEMKKHMGTACHTLSFFSQSMPEVMVTVAIPKYGKYGQPSVLDSFRKRCGQPAIWEPFGEGFGVRIGIGEYVEDVEREKRKAYETAAKALEYAFYFPDTNICESGKLSGERDVSVCLDIIKEEWLADAIRAGEAEKSWERMEELLEGLLAKGYPSPEGLVMEAERMLKHVSMTLSYPVGFSAAGFWEGWSYREFKEHLRSYIQEFAQEIEMRSDGKNGRFCRKFIAYMKEHYMEDISLDDVAAQFRFTPAYCSRLIKEATNSNFKQILIEERVKKAKELLGHTEMHIYEVAETVGYHDARYFNRVFKAATGMTPQQYRREGG